MCLLIVLSRVRADVPLVVAANRDEQYSRPTTDAMVLSESPRIVGGRDELAGGTWLAMNPSGVVAGLANQPSPAGRDASKRSRGEIPLELAGFATAREAVEHFVSAHRVEDYNACGVLVGDRASLFYIELSVAGEGPPPVFELPPGVHLLANGPLFEPSAKVARVRAMLDAGVQVDAPLDTLTARLESILRDHGDPLVAENVDALTSRDNDPCCVHRERFGTRSAAILRVAAEGEPTLLVASGAPCTHPFRDVSSLFD